MSICNEESLDPGQKPNGERRGTCVCCSSELSCYNPPATAGTKHSITKAGIGVLGRKKERGLSDHQTIF